MIDSRSASAHVQRILSILLLALSLQPFSLHALPAQESQAGGPLHFRITLDKAITPKGISGRLLVLMSDSEQKQTLLRTDFLPGSTYISAMEVEYFAAGQSVELDPDIRAYPQPFSQMKPGNYQFMALLDPDHSLPYAGEDAGDLYGPVISVENLDPAHGGELSLLLDRRIEPKPPLTDTDSVKLVEFQSPSLSAFWGRPILMQAGVVLPPGTKGKPEERFPTVYHVHGFGGDHREAWYVGPALVAAMASGKRMKAVHVLRLLSRRFCGRRFCST